MYKIKTVKLKHCTCLMRLYYISPSYKLTITTLFKNCLKQLLKKTLSLTPLFHCSRPYSQPYDSMVSFKSRGSGTKIHKKGQKNLGQFYLPDRT